MNRFSTLILPAALLIASPASSQDANRRDEKAGPPGCCGNMQGAGPGMKGDVSGSFTGQHMLILTINWIDAQTGMVDGTADGMAMRLQFPPEALAGLTAGDRIMVHLAFQKM